MIISSSVLFVNLILMWIWDQQGFQFLNKPNKFEEKKKTHKTFESTEVRLFNAAGWRGGGGRRSQAGGFEGLVFARVTRSWNRLPQARPAALCRAHLGDHKVAHPGVTTGTLPLTPPPPPASSVPQNTFVRQQSPGPPSLLWKNAACPPRPPPNPTLSYLLGTGRAQLGLR